MWCNIQVFYDGTRILHHLKKNTGYSCTIQRDRENATVQSNDQSLPSCDSSGELHSRLFINITAPT